MLFGTYGHAPIPGPIQPPDSYSSLRTMSALSLEADIGLFLVFLRHHAYSLQQSPIIVFSLFDRLGSLAS